MPGVADTPSADPVAEIFFRYGTPVFYAFAATGVALLAYGLISKSRGPARRRCTILGALIVCVTVASFCQLAIDKDRGFIAEQDRRIDAKFQKIETEQGEDEALKIQYMYMPTGNSLFYITLGNPSLAADYVWLTSLQFVSNSFRRHGKFDMLARFHHTMVDLDPHWVDAHVDGARVLSALINDEEKSVRRRMRAGEKLDSREKSEECYKYAIEKNLYNPEVWRLRYEAGLLYVMPPNDPAKMSEYSRKSAKYLDDAMQEKRFPKGMLKVTADRIARLQLESGSAFYREAEERMAANATDPESPESLREISKRDWLKAHSMALAAALTDEAAKYKKEKGEFPASLDIITQRFENPKAFATDAYGFAFDYDPTTGEVTSRGAKALHAIQAGHVVNELIGVFKNEHNGRTPKDLPELRDFVRSTTEPPLHPPSVMVLEAIGDARAIAADTSEDAKLNAQKHLNPTKGPLGPWAYDAQKGEIVFPPECDAKVLYGHINDFDWKSTGIVRK